MHQSSGRASPLPPCASPPMPVSHQRKGMMILTHSPSPSSPSSVITTSSPHVPPRANAVSPVTPALALRRKKMPRSRSSVVLGSPGARGFSSLDLPSFSFSESPNASPILSTNNLASLAPLEQSQVHRPILKDHSDNDSTLDITPQELRQRKRKTKLPSLGSEKDFDWSPSSSSSGGGRRHHGHRRRSVKKDLSMRTSPLGLRLLSTSVEVDDKKSNLLSIGIDFDLSSSLPNSFPTPGSRAKMSRRRTLSTSMSIGVDAVFVPPTPSHGQGGSSKGGGSKGGGSNGGGSKRSRFGFDMVDLSNSAAHCSMSSIVEAEGDTAGEGAGSAEYDLADDWTLSCVRLADPPADSNTVPIGKADRAAKAKIPAPATMMQAVTRFVCQPHSPLFPDPVFFNQMDIARLIMMGGGVKQTYRWVRQFVSMGNTFNTFDRLLRETHNMQKEYLHLQKSVYAHLNSQDSNLLPMSVARMLQWEDASNFLDRCGAGSQTIVYLWILDSRHESYPSIDALVAAMGELHVSWSQRNMEHKDTVGSFLKSSQCTLFAPDVRKDLQIDDELLGEVVTAVGDASEVVAQLKRMTQDKQSPQTGFASFKHVAEKVISIRRAKDAAAKAAESKRREEQEALRKERGVMRNGRVGLLKVQIPGDKSKVTPRLQLQIAQMSGGLSARRKTMF